MKRLFYVSGMILIILLISSCKKKPQPPSVSETTVSEVTTTTAVSGGNITDDGGAQILSRGVCWDFKDSPTAGALRISEKGEPGEFIINIPQLLPDKQYYLRAFATNSAGTGYGNTVSFRTLGDVPVTNNLTASNILSDAATLKGSVNANLLPTTVIFEFGTTTGYGDTISAIQSPVTGNTVVNVSAELTGLVPNTSYHARIKTENTLGITYTDDISFTTSTNEWLEYADFPGTARRQPLSFTYEGKGYFGLGINSLKLFMNDFWMFDPADGTWTRLADCPFTVYTYMNSWCRVDSIVYVFSDWKLYSYNINLNSWEFIIEVEDPLSGFTCFSIDHKAYFFERENSKLYEYDPVAKIFVLKSARISHYYPYFTETFTINNEGFVVFRSVSKVEILHYVPQSDSWEKMAEKEFLSNEFDRPGFIITINNSVYIGQSTSYWHPAENEDNYTAEWPSTKVWVYNYSTNEFRQFVNIPGPFKIGAGSFSFDDTGYVIGGITINAVTRTERYLNEIWMLKP